MKDGFLEDDELTSLTDYINDQSDAAFSDFYLRKLNAGTMLYGTGSAQSGYLRAEDVATKFAKSGTVAKHEVKAALMGTHLNAKTDRVRVANYWLEQVQSKVNTTLNEKDFKAKDETRGKFWERYDASLLSMKQLKDTKFEGKLPGTAPKAAPNTVAEQRDVIYDLTIRRSCKFLMYDAIDLGNNVFYALDDLDLPRIAYVIDKSVPVTAASYPAASRARKDANDAVVHDDEGKVPVCSSELRELFRYWDYFKRYVTFFERLRVVKAPWDRMETADVWAHYAKYRARVLAAKIQSKSHSLSERIEQVEKLSGLQAVEAYHNLAPTRLLGRGPKVNIGASVAVEQKRGGKKK